MGPGQTSDPLPVWHPPGWPPAAWLRAGLVLVTSSALLYPNNDILYLFPYAGLMQGEKPDTFKKSPGEPLPHRVVLSKVFGPGRGDSFAHEIIDWVEEHLGTRTPGLDVIRCHDSEDPWVMEFIISFADPGIAMLFKLRFAGYEEG